MSGPQPIITPGVLTPTPGRQMQVVVGAFAVTGAAGLMRNPRNLVRSWKFGASTMASITELSGALPALGPSQKFGVRYGGAGVATIGSTAIGNMYMGGTPEADLPFPTFAFGLTAVPNTSSRLVYENNKSRPGQAKSVNTAVRMTTMRKSMRRASAQKKARRRRAKIIPRRGTRCPPGYRYDAKRKMCIQTFKR